MKIMHGQRCCHRVDHSWRAGLIVSVMVYLPEKVLAAAAHLVAVYGRRDTPAYFDSFAPAATWPAVCERPSPQPDPAAS